MEKLFTYGTLQDPHVQQRVFGRVAGLEDDVLDGFRRGTIVINGTTYFCH